MKPSIAVLIPCYNEAATIEQVVSDFREALPAAAVYVYDNNSTDDTAARARAAGAIVRSEHRQGKGHVVRRMLADVRAQYYVIVDGDATYHAPSAQLMLDLLVDYQFDLVNGRRMSDELTAFRPGHRFGNRLFSSLIARLFGRDIGDVLSGYKVMSRRFVKSFPVYSGGFEIETELAVHALTLGVPMTEVETPYRMRPSGSSSKLRAIPDGLKILRAIARLLKEERPLMFFGVVATLLSLVSLILAAPLFVEFAQTGYVPRVPTAVLCTGTMVVAMLAATGGVVLESVKRGQREIKRLLYLQSR
ncbi:MAG: glycosyltransferase family 2 protein [Panacagrimonas sp.]